MFSRSLATLVKMGVIARPNSGHSHKRPAYDEDDEETAIKREDAQAEGSDSDILSESDSDEDGFNDDQQMAAGACEYYENDEPLPNAAAYDLDFAALTKKLLRIPTAAIDIIDTSACTSIRVQSHQATADALITLPPAQREKIVLLGNTGSGKSSLLNSLLAIPNLAKAMDSGESCTDVSTEYEGPFAGQTAPFAAKIQYFSTESIEALLRRLIYDYSIWNFQRPEDGDQEEMQELDQLSTTAFNIFRSLFCDKRQFSSSQAAEKCLESSLKDKQFDALPLMMQWSKDLLRGKEVDLNRHIEVFSADTQHDLLSELDPLTSSSSRFERPALWPLVEKVRIGIRDSRIAQHATIIDLPGLDDTNRIRADAKLDVMRDCDSLWIVAKIGRIVTDSSVDALLMRYGKSYNVTVVCTGIDEHLDDALAVHLQNEGLDLGNHDELLQKEKRSSRIKKKLTRKIGNRQAKLEGRGRSRRNKKQRLLTDKARAKLEDQVEKYKHELAEATKEHYETSCARFELLVAARNRWTTQRLQEDKSRHLPADTTLEVFCVSNAHYAALKGIKEVHGPRLKVQDTGIPALRKFVLRSAAPLQLQALEDYINHRFTAFMEGLAVWVKSYSVDGAVELLESIKSFTDRLPEPIERYLTKTKAANDAANIIPLAGAREELISGAIAELEKKKDWHWQTLRAFIRRDGRHSTRRAPRQSWNEQFQSKATELVEDKWIDFLARQNRLSKALKLDMLSIVDAIAKTIEDHPSYSALPQDRIRSMLGAQCNGIKQAWRDVQNQQTKELRNIKLDLTQDRPSSYFTRAMRDSYNTCKQDTGTGIKARSLAVFEKHLRLEGMSSPFHLMAMSLSKALEEDSRARMQTLSHQVKNIIDDIYRQFRDIVDLEGNDRVENRLRKDMRKFLETAEAEFASAKADLAMIKERYALPQ